MRWRLVLDAASSEKDAKVEDIVNSIAPKEVAEWLLEHATIWETK